MSNESNPLRQFYRTEKLWISLPSDGNFYDDVLELNSNNEIGIFSMTAADEVLFKNPDALLSGDAIKRTIQSCVPGIKKVEALLSNDVDTLIVAIRHASFGDSLDVVSACPECGVESTFSLPIEETLSSADKLDKEYPINLDSGVTVFIKPHTFADNLIAISKSFEQNNIIKNVENPSFDENQKIKMLGQSIDTLAKMNFDLVGNCVMRVYKDDGEDGIDVTNVKHIKEFIKNIGRGDIKKIQNKLEEINNIGINKEFEATCEKCEYTWNVPIDFNPTTFFTDSLQ